MNVMGRLKNNWCQGRRGRGRANDSNKYEQKHWFDTLDEIRQDETFESDYLIATIQMLNGTFCRKMSKNVLLLNHVDCDDFN